MIDWTKPIRVKAATWHDYNPQLEVGKSYPQYTMIHIRGDHQMSPHLEVKNRSTRHFTNNGKWKYDHANRPSLEIENVPEEKSVTTEFISKPVDLEKPIRLTAYGEYEEIYDLAVVSVGDNSANITVNAPHLIGTTRAKAGATWAFNLKDGTIFAYEGRSPVLENYDEDTVDADISTLEPTEGIDWSKPLRTVETKWQPSIPVRMLRKTDDGFYVLEFLGDHHLADDELGEDKWGSGEQWIYRKDGTYGADEGRDIEYLVIENDPGPVTLDWSKPLRSVATEWQHSVSVEIVEHDPSDNTYLVKFSEEVYVSKFSKEETYAKDEELYFWPSGLSYEQSEGEEPNPDFLHLENWNPDIMALDTPAPTAEENKVATKEAEAKERWDYPTKKKHKMEEGELLFHLRKLVHRNNVESWHLSRIKTEGFGAKRFVINRRKPVVWRDFRTGKTFVMKNVALHDEDEGTFMALNEKDNGNFTENVANEGRARIWTKDGLYKGDEEAKQFGLFNEEILLIYELTIESESSLTELLSAVYGELD